MAQMQQMYTQFLAQYNLQPNAANAPAFPNMFNADGQANEPLNNPPVAPVEDQVAGPIRLDDAEEDEDENRDWLDMFYWFSRFVVLFSVVYFYSSFTRFALVVSIAILMYLHHLGFIFPRNNNQQAPARRQEQVIPARPADADNGEGNNVAEPLTDSPVTERCSGLRLFWVIVSSLFTSLIPETQAPINLN